MATADSNLRDPVLEALLAAPVDDVPETDEEREACEAGMEAIRAGHWVPQVDVHAELERRRAGRA